MKSGLSLTGALLGFLTCWILAGMIWVYVSRQPTAAKLLPVTLRSVGDVDLNLVRWVRGRIDAVTRIWNHEEVKTNPTVFDVGAIPFHIVLRHLSYSLFIAGALILADVELASILVAGLIPIAALVMRAVICPGFLGGFRVRI